MRGPVAGGAFIRRALLGLSPPLSSKPGTLGSLRSSALIFMVDEHEGWERSF